MTRAGASRVLELGFGPGLSIEACAARATEGRVVGVDHSEVMVDVASRRNAVAIAQGRVELHAASFDALPKFDVPFDRIFGVNAIQFASDEGSLLLALRQRLRAGGRIAVTFQSRRAGATSEDTAHGGATLAESLEAAGFAEVRVEVLPLEPVSAVCVIGIRPPSL